MKERNKGQTEGKRGVNMEEERGMTGGGGKGRKEDRQEKEGQK